MLSVRWNSGLDIRPGYMTGSDTSLSPMANGKSIVSLRNFWYFRDLRIVNAIYSMDDIR